MINLKLAEQLSFNYKNAHPFPHVIIDNFLENKFARIAVDELRNFQMWDHDPTDYSSDVQQNKFFCPGVDAHLEMMKKDTVMTYQILHFLNSDITLKYLEKLTGINGLLPDPRFIGGGYQNTISSTRSSIVGGYNNITSAGQSFIGGGYDNRICGLSNYSSIVGGYCNRIFSGSCYSIIGGGYCNRIYEDSKNSTIAGGYYNKVCLGSCFSTIAGGAKNCTKGDYVIIGGGYKNYSVGDTTTIAGGFYNSIDGKFSTIGGGGAWYDPSTSLNCLPKIVGCFSNIAGGAG